jgi:hypothetical protein
MANPNGHHRFPPENFNCPGLVVADPGWKIVHVTGAVQPS